MKRLIALFLFVILLTASVAYLNLGKIIGRAVNRSCSNCELSLPQVSLRISPFRAELHGAKFRDGDPNDTEVVFEVKHATVPFSPRDILGGRYHFGEVVLSGLSVTITEGDVNTPSTAGGEVDLRVEGVKIVDSAFRYRRLYSGKDAKIDLSQIQATIGGFATSGDLKNQRTKAEVKARLEKSGDVTLLIDALVFGDGPDVRVDLAVNGQQLPDLDGYFFPSDGIRLSGLLKESRAKVVVAAQALEAEVRVVYHGLDVVFSSNRDRSGTTAFFSNLLRGIKIDDKNTNEARKDQRRAVKLKRRPGESLVSFILRGMKDGALGVATT